MPFKIYIPPKRAIEIRAGEAEYIAVEKMVLGVPTARNSEMNAFLNFGADGNVLAVIRTKGRQEYENFLVALVEQYVQTLDKGKAPLTEHERLQLCQRFIEAVQSPQQEELEPI